jgi:hypothetical protein
VILRRREDDDGVRDDEAKTMVAAAWSGAARVGVEVRTETRRRRRDPKVDVDVVLLREKGRKGYQRMRTGERRRGDHRVVAQTHRVADAELTTAAVLSNSGERSWERRCARERENGGEWKRGARRGH